MISKHRPNGKYRALTTRLGSVLLLFQRTPIVQMFFPEAKIIGAAGLGEIATWTIATVAGLGAYDSVAGATTLKQIKPLANSTTVPGKVGSNLTFVFQITGTESSPKTWEIIGALPAGLTHTNSTGNTVDSITGTPSESGDFPITIKAWEKAHKSGISYSQKFTFSITGSASPLPTIVSDPISQTVKKGKKATLVVRGSGSSLKYQWYIGATGVTKKPVAGATSAVFKTPKMKRTTKYWVRVTNTAGSVDSKTATIIVR